MDIWLGNTGYETKLPSPSSFDVGEKQITREGRVASGKLVMDIIAVKKVFTIGYKHLTGPELETILAEFRKNTFLNFKYTDYDASEKAYTVKFTGVPRALLFDVNDWLWKDVSLQLEEV